MIIILIFSLLEIVYQITIKIYRAYSYVIFGSQKVGKTNIISRIIKDQFQQTHKHTLQNMQTTLINMNGKIFQINLHDTAGHEQVYFTQLGSSNNPNQKNNIIKHIWRNNKDGFIFAFALNCQDSFWKVVHDIKQIKQSEQYSNVTIILLGNKKDLQIQREICKKTIEAFAQSYGIKYFQISAKQSDKNQIDEIIFQLIQINQMNQFLYRSNSQIHIDSQYNRIQAENGSNQQKNNKRQRQTTYSKQQKSTKQHIQQTQQSWLKKWNPCEDITCKIM